MTDIDFTDPVPETTYARVALTGPSGVGKTWSALLMMRGMVGEDGMIALVDTEHKTASKYRKFHDFRVCNLDYYDPKNLITAVAKATQRGFDGLIVDSGSHFWSGRGGVLQLVDEKAGDYANNKWSGWKDVRPLETEMLEALLSFPGHLIVTMRVKTEWVLETTPGGKTKPVKVGLKPEQRENIDHEFDLVGDMDQQHVLTVSKTRIHEIDLGEAVTRPDIEFGARIAAALREGATPPAVNAAMIRDWRARLLAGGVTRDEIGIISKAASEAGALAVAVTDQAGGTVSMRTLIRQQWRVTPAAPEEPVNVSPPVPAAEPGEGEDDADEVTAEWAEQFTARVQSFTTPMAGEGLRDQLTAAMDNGTCPPGLAAGISQLIDERIAELDKAAAVPAAPEQTAAPETTGPAAPVPLPADDMTALLRDQIAEIRTQRDVNNARKAVQALTDDTVKRELNDAVTERWNTVKAGQQR